MQIRLRALPHSLVRQYCTIDRRKVCELITALTQRGGEIMMKELVKKPEYKTKSHARDVVTETDFAVERLLISGIRAQFPDHQVIAEEGTEGTAESNILSDAPTWIIDPIDGTLNYVHGFPHFCTSIALYVKKRGEFGWIYNPMLGHRYTVQRGRGVFFNGKQVRTSGQRDLKQSIIYCELSRKVNDDELSANTDNVLNLLPLVHGIRSLGSTALNLAHVAMGATDAFLQFGAHVWDWAAGVMMVREAGGVVLDPCGGEFDIYSRRMLAAATPELAQQILPLLSQIFPQPRDDEPAQLGQ